VITRTLEYLVPESAEEAAEMLAASAGDATLLAGGTWVVPDMTHGKVRPTRVIDLRRAGLSEIREEDGHVVVGATATYSEIVASSLLRERAGLLPLAAAKITGGAQVRNFATAGGSACYAIPSSDAPAWFVALGAKMRLLSAEGEREVAAEDFFRGAFRTTARPDEVLTRMAIPTPPAGARFAYHKLKFGESGWPIATAACVLGLDEEGRCRSASLALGAVAETPLRVEVGDVLEGSPVTPEAAREVEEIAHRAVEEPWTDVLADGEYRKSVAGVVAKRALLAAADGG
jgi:CO/xanthine dehydrogenase FAD-binding subunit